MDVEGAFDATLQNRLILQLRKQGWPEFLARWIATFLAQRLASVCFEDATAQANAAIDALEEWGRREGFASDFK